MFAVDGRGHVFGLSPENAAPSTKGVYQWSGTPNQWRKIGGPGGQIYAGWDQLLFVTNPETGDLWHYRPACATITQPPDFSGPIVSEKLKAVSGTRNMVAILWDPYQKLKLGWMKWKVADKDGIFTLNDVETQGDALILYNPKRGTDEYFILENRWRGSSYDAGAAVAAGGDGIPSDGLAVWHIVENAYAYKDAGVSLPGGGWGRWVVRMVRANGGNPVDDSNALFSKSGTVLSDVTAPANLNWLGGPSGFRVRLLTEAGPTIKVEVSRACY